MTLLVVLVVVGGTWLVGQHAGFGEIGTGGANLRLLPRIGEAAPDIELFSLTDGRRVRLSDFRGQPVWLNFWGSWCPPCRSEFPELQAAYADTLAPNGVVFLAISLDEPAEAAALYAARNEGTFTILSDPDRRDTGSAYPIANFPTHILVDRDGVVRDIILSPMDQTMIIEAAQVIIAPESSP
ncbi:MAG: TlpA family protein disulfide reductase [Thermomicrobiales bacterium]|nr:TlpA family protein disulfide reductase [Thermomicrobiales bacterium]